VCRAVDNGRRLESDLFHRDPVLCVETGSRLAPGYGPTAGTPQLRPASGLSHTAPESTISRAGGVRAATADTPLVPLSPVRAVLGPSVLVVDDDPGILATLSELLSIEGYSVCTASNGAQALSLVDHAAPRLVLLDLRMPAGRLGVRSPTRTASSQASVAGHDRH
jgi:hypothetical protein